jgi:hypothetical protein
MEGLVDGLVDLTAPQVEPGCYCSRASKCRCVSVGGLDPAVIDAVLQIERFGIEMGYSLLQPRFGSPAKPTLDSADRAQHLETPGDCQSPFRR